MQKLSGLMVGVMLITVVGVAAVARDQGDRGGGMMGPGSMMQGGETGAGMMGMGDMCGVMAGGMMGKSMVPVDGGVIVMVGNKLLKYDRNLKLVKETELQIDMQEMRQMMQRIREQCPMHGRESGGVRKSTGTPAGEHIH